MASIVAPELDSIHIHFLEWNGTESHVGLGVHKVRGHSISSEVDDSYGRLPYE